MHLKRSTINRLIVEAKELRHKHHFMLPQFAFWDPQTWADLGHEADEIRESALGWNVTDFGAGDFKSLGLLLFTIRNGNYHLADQYPKSYAEKVMVVRPGQITPRHFHWKKRENIINRGGGDLVLEVYKSGKDEELSDEHFFLSLDGVRKDCTPGERIVLTPGDSICLKPGVYHTFYGARETDSVLVGEVSAVNDDANDNRFLEPMGRFPTIEEDEEPIHLLCIEYPSA